MGAPAVSFLKRSRPLMAATAVPAGSLGAVARVRAVGGVPGIKSSGWLHSHSLTTIVQVGSCGLALF
ncbi:hypothetical protein Amac_002700 [Acrocarpospora macrocephala]|uniref:Uncharacterized protein n=1 Tax=Acrocarpospora macrocephala TaxID=150177 RepID=A0A5M3WC85_9ACTN|nr:hypothetical protein Amac_002700 [Acrocarpospora macrocephala]